MMEKKLPIGWIETGLLNIVEVCTGKKDANYATSDGKYLFFTCAYEPLRSDDYSFEGDVLILPGNGVNVGEVFYYSGKFEAYQRTYIVSNIKIDPKYLFYHFKRYWKEIGTAQQYGSATNYIKIGNFNDYRISFPPLPEQQRIVAKLDTLFGHLDALKPRLDRIPQLLKDFRQKVLTQAVTGNFEDYIEFGDYGVDIQTGPFGSALHKEEYIENGIPVINPSHIIDGEIIPDQQVTITEGKLEELSRWILEDGDVILGRRGEMGRAAVYFEKNKKMICGTGSLVLKKSTRMDSMFLMYYLRSQYTISYLTANSVGSTMVNLNQKIIRSIPFPDLDIDEQKQRIEMIESLFAKADQIETSYQKLKVKIEQLPQALLAKAFRGELVEQLPTDGDALDLLEQIKRAKEGLEKGGKGKKMKVEDELRMVAEDGARYGKK